MMRSTQLALAALAVLGMTACPSASTPVDPDAAAAVVAYRDALAAGKPREAFAWIHVDGREGMDERAFEALYLRHRAALVAQADELVRLARKQDPAQRAKVRTDKGEVVLEKGPEGWRLLAPVP